MIFLTDQERVDAKTNELARRYVDYLRGVDLNDLDQNKIWEIFKSLQSLRIFVQPSTKEEIEIVVNHPHFVSGIEDYTQKRESRKQFTPQFQKKIQNLIVRVASEIENQMK